LLPESGDQGWSRPHSTQSVTRMVAQFPKRLGTQIRQLMVLPVPPQVFHGIQFRSIGRQKIDRQPPATFRDEILDESTPVLPQPVPDHQQSPGYVPQQVAKEQHDLRRPYAPRKEPEVEPPPRYSCDRGEVVPMEVVLQHGSLSSWSPSAADMGPLR